MAITGIVLYMLLITGVLVRYTNDAIDAAKIGRKNISSAVLLNVQSCLYLKHRYILQREKSTEKVDIRD